MNHIKDKIVLVTGGSGSIGSELVRQCLAAQARVVRVFSRDESRQYHMQQKLRDDRLRFLIGDVRDKDRLKRAMKDVDLVFHAAALKQVPYCEYNPFEAVQTNVVGSHNLVSAALENQVKRVVAISTDKAVNPVNTMGATKLLSERVVTRANMWTSDTVFSCVRFGNVLGSRGSVASLIEQQVLQGEPVQLTDPQMTRFMMTISDAVELVMEASSLAHPGDTYVLPMKSLQVKDLIEILRDHFCEKHSLPQAPITTIGCRPGEKIYEELVTTEELTRLRKDNGFFVIENIPSSRTEPFVTLKPEEYLSHRAPSLTTSEVKNMIIKSGII